MERTIWFDMDGTIADLYGQTDWLEKIRSHDASPFANARPLINMNRLARKLNQLKKQGWKLGIVSWLSKEPDEEYDKLVTETKKRWLAKHLASVGFDTIDILPYGTPKGEGRQGILFDDERGNREQWGEGAYDVHNILEVLKGLE